MDRNATQWMKGGTPRRSETTVHETLGGNRGQNGQTGPWGRITGMTHIFQLFGDDSPHSTYRCEEHANARCGDKP